MEQKIQDIGALRNLRLETGELTDENEDVFNIAMEGLLHMEDYIFDRMGFNNLTDSGIIVYEHTGGMFSILKNMRNRNTTYLDIGTFYKDSRQFTSIICNQEGNRIIVNPKGVYFEDRVFED